jgi:hypothetical protein
MQTSSTFDNYPLTRKNSRFDPNISHEAELPRGWLRRITASWVKGRIPGLPVVLFRLAEKIVGYRFHSGALERNTRVLNKGSFRILSHLSLTAFPF